MRGKVRPAVCIGVVQRERVWDWSPCAGTRCAGSSDSHSSCSQPFTSPKSQLGLSNSKPVKF